MKRLWWSLSGLAVAFTLAVVLFPLYAPVRREPRAKPTCLVNAKFLALSLLMYASDCDDRLPEATRWTSAAEQYKGLNEFTQCPSLPKGSFGYAFNAELSKSKITATNLPLPMIFETTAPGRNVSDRLASLPRPGRHDGASFIAYTDGSARARNTP